MESGACHGPSKLLPLTARQEVYVGMTMAGRSQALPNCGPSRVLRIFLCRCLTLRHCTVYIVSEDILPRIL